MKIMLNLAGYPANLAGYPANLTDAGYLSQPFVNIYAVLKCVNIRDRAHTYVEYDVSKAESYICRVYVMDWCCVQNT